jgi:hypothetical protein
MSTQPPEEWAITQPKISADKVLKLAKVQNKTQGDLAETLGIGHGAMSRGMRSQKWLHSKISQISAALKCDATELMDSNGGANGNSVLERVCGQPANTGFRLPVGCDMRMLKVNDVWGFYLLAPESVPAIEADFVMLETGPKSRLLVCQIKTASDSEWTVMRGSEKPEKITIPKETVKTMRVILPYFGGARSIQ